MKNLYTFLFLLFLTTTISAQDIYLHCGKLIDTENGKILQEQTIVIAGEKSKRCLMATLPRKAIRIR